MADSLKKITRKTSGIESIRSKALKPLQHQPKTVSITTAIITLAMLKITPNMADSLKDIDEGNIKNRKYQGYLIRFFPVNK
jgi:hypothetical protein